MKQVASSSLELMLSDPMLRMRLAYSWPRAKCRICGATAQGVYEVHFHIRPRKDEADADTPDWHEYVLGCHSCFTSDFGRGLKPQAELPHVFPPLYPRRVRINLILPLTCISQASAGMREMLA